jgi:hypothetical protein
VFHKWRGVFSLAERLLISEERLGAKIILNIFRGFPQNSFFTHPSQITTYRSVLDLIVFVLYMAIKHDCSEIKVLPTQVKQWSP